MSEANISQTCCEAILNTDFSTAKGKKDFLGNVNEGMANQGTLEVHEKCIDIKTSHVENFESSSIQDASTINGDDLSEPHHLLIILLPILLVRWCKAQVREWKKEKRRKDPRNLKRIRSQPSFLGTGKPRRSLLCRSQHGGKSFLRNGWLLKVWITVSCGLCFHSSIAVSTPPVSKPKIVIHARVNESLSISCDGVARSDFRWMRYFSTEKRQERLYKSGNTRNCTNVLMTCLPNGTFIFQSVQVSDMGEYICIVHQTAETDSSQFAYSLIVQISDYTIGSSQAEVTHGNITESKCGGVIAWAVIGSVMVFAAVAVFIWCLVRKRRSRELTGGVSVGNGVPTATEAHTTTIPMLNGHQSQLSQ